MLTRIRTWSPKIEIRMESMVGEKRRGFCAFWWHLVRVLVYSRYWYNWKGAKAFALHNTMLLILIITILLSAGCDTWMGHAPGMNEVCLQIWSIVMMGVAILFGSQTQKISTWASISDAHNLSRTLQYRSKIDSWDALLFLGFHYYGTLPYCPIRIPECTSTELAWAPRSSTVPLIFSQSSQRI